jgi:arabinofuranosyltransferase
MTENRPSSTLNPRVYLIALLSLVFFTILLRTAWVGDDSFITMRTVDNFLHGYGLTWNMDERVQTFTHPLWLFLLCGSYLFTQNAYFAVVGLCLVVSTLTMVVFLANTSGDVVNLILGAAVLIFSNAFIDYSTSGLENPASHLIALGFVLLFLNPHAVEDDRGTLFLGLLAGLSMLNRMDTVLLYIPPLVFLLFEKRTWRTVGLILAGFLPFLIWEIFSVIYYGFPLPNTFYAKLNTGIPLSLMLQQGILYYLDSLIWDPLTLIVIAMAAFFSVRQKKQLVLVIGIGLYLAYVLFIGGDFMSGRFFSIVMLTSATMLIRQVQNLDRTVKIILLGVIVFLGFVAPVPSFGVPAKRSVPTDDYSGVGDEQAWYFPYSGLANWGRNHPLPDPGQEWVKLGKQLRDEGEAVYVGKGIGYLGYYAGPKVHIMDIFGIADPLLARLPAAPEKTWRIGHFKRNIPPGYVQTFRDQQNDIKDVSLRSYYDHLSLIIRGPLWSSERWQAIWNMNTGQYNYLIDSYTESGTRQEGENP